MDEKTQGLSDDAREDLERIEAHEKLNRLVKELGYDVWDFDDEWPIGKGRSDVNTDDESR